MCPTRRPCGTFHKQLSFDISKAKKPLVFYSSSLIVRACRLNLQILIIY